jgi:ABC-type branched-subunit amino acid transport system ATPase component
LLPEYWLPGFLRRRREREVRDAQADLAREASAGRAAPHPAAAGVARKPGGAGVLMRVQHVSKSFGGIQALKDFSTTLETGKITSLIGPNGAGKTTAFNVITGFLTPDSGTVELGGRDITRAKPHEMASLGVARSFQNLRLFLQMSVLDNVMVAVRPQQGEKLWRTLLLVSATTREERVTRRKALAILNEVGLRDKALELAENLSYAEEKLLGLARMMAMDADLLLLDEPGSGLDPASLDAMFAMIRGLANSGKTVCIIEHNLDVIKELSDKVVFLDEGRALAEGPPEAILRNPELADRYFGA